MSKRKKSIQLKLFRSTLSLYRAIAKATEKFINLIIGAFFYEIFIWAPIFLLAYLFASLGISANFSWFLAKCTFLALITLPLVIFFVVPLISDFSSQPKKVKRNKARNKVKGEAKLALWIAQSFSNKTSIEWAEYQDWLHDIFLARRQLLDAKCPRWKVTIITYWRLSTFLVIVSLSKIKSLAVSVMRFR